MLYIGRWKREKKIRLYDYIFFFASGDYIYISFQYLSRWSKLVMVNSYVVWAGDESYWYIYAYKEKGFGIVKIAHPNSRSHI